MKVEEIPLLVLAGGKATRLAHLTRRVPKYLQPIDDSFCFADIHLRWVKQQGFKTVILSLGYLGEEIRRYCGDGSSFGLDIRYLEDGSTPLGTGGPLRLTLDLPFQAIAVTYGDTVLRFSCQDFIDGFLKSECLAGITLYPNDLPGHSCNAHLEGSRATYDKENPDPSWKLIDYGFLIFMREAVMGFPAKIPLDLSMPLKFFSKDSNLFGYLVESRFWEIGTPEALDGFRREFSKPKSSAE